MKKRLTALILCVLCILLFSGCNAEGISFVSALREELQITSMKTTDVLSAQMKITLPEELKEETDPFYLQSLLNMLSAFHIEGTTLYQKNGSTLTEKANLSLISEDICFDTEIYTAVTNNNLITAIKIPTPAKAFLPEEYTNATYFSIDTKDGEAYAQKLEKLEQLQAEYFDYEYTEPELHEMIFTNHRAAADTLNQTLMKFLQDYAEQMSDTPKIVSKSGNTYSLYLTDESFKELLSSIVAVYFEKPAARAAADELMEAYRTYYQTVSPDTNAQEWELPKLPEDNPALVANLQAQAKLFLNMLKPIRLIGEEGIRIDCKLNSAGYIGEINTNLHLDIDLNALTELIEGEAYYEEAFAFDIKLQHNQKRQNINGIVKIPTPTLNDDTNLPFFRMMTDELQEEIDYYQTKIDNGESFENDYGESDETIPLPAKDGSITVLTPEEWPYVVEFGEHSPFISEAGTLYVPMEPMLDYMGMSYDWNPKTGYALFTNPYYEGWMWFRPGDRVICCDDYELTLSAPTVDKDGQIYLPLRSFTSAFSNSKIRWNAEENAAYLIPWYFMD